MKKLKPDIIAGIALALIVLLVFLTAWLKRPVPVDKWNGVVGTVIVIEEHPKI